MDAPGVKVVVGVKDQDLFEGSALIEETKEGDVSLIKVCRS